MARSCFAEIEGLITEGTSLADESASPNVRRHA
jgi:hypothetical protein